MARGGLRRECRRRWSLRLVPNPSRPRIPTNSNSKGATNQMLKNFARLLAVAAFAVVLAAVPTSASAAGGGGGTGLNVTIGSATVQARLLGTLPVTLTSTASLPT